MPEREYNPVRDPAIWSILALALLFRVGYNFALHAGGHSASNFVIDEREYFGAAHMLAEGRGFSFFDTALWLRPPIYVLFLAPLIGVGDQAVLLAQSILSALTLLPLALIGASLGGRRAARWTGALGALYLPFTLFAGLLLSETLFVFLFAWAIWALLCAVQEAGSGRYWLWPAVAGALFGLATLTRATALAFLPLAAVWLLVVMKSSGRSRGWVAAGVFLVCGIAVLVPWTVRNYIAYGRLVAVDTTSGYNLWLGSVGVRDEPRLQADLQAIPNPADKQAFAYERAWENIRSDPSFFVEKGLKESIDLWRPLFQAEEHQVAGYSLGRVPSWHLYSIFALDDLLYLAVLLLALVGLVFVRPHPARSLTLLWVLLWVAMSFVFFAVTRFRLPVVASLLPWAGAGVVQLPGIASRLSEAPRRRPLVILAGAVAILLVLVPGMTFTLQSASLGIERWAQQGPYREAESLVRKGDVRAAVPLYRKANLDLADTRYALAAALLRTDDTRDALAQLRPDEPADRFEPYIIRGEAARLSGDLDAARTFFNERVVKLAGDDALQWAWDHIHPPPVTTLEIGSGLDIGYIRGFYPPETSKDGLVFRWTTGQAEVRGIRLSGDQIGITLSGWRPDGSPPAQVSIRSPEAEQEKKTTLTTQDVWTNEELITGPGTYSLRTSVNEFVPGGSDPRLLGVRVSSVGAGK